MPNISFALTTPQLLAGEKFVTRRLGWPNIKIGEVHNAVDRVMGFKRGEHPVTLCQIVPIHARLETLSWMVDYQPYGVKEVTLEGFPDMSPRDFVDFFCNHNKCGMLYKVNRIALGLWRDGKVWIAPKFHEWLSTEMADFETKFPGLLARE